ncbi:hypothetical protein BD408DRAFT_408880, partial [Parasitella parasitica]
MSSHQFSSNDYLNNEQVCKILSEDQNIIDIITENLLNVYENTYMCDSFEILGNGVRITYKPRLVNHSALPPIILNFQPYINQDAMTNAIDRCYQVQVQKNQLPLILFICSERLSDPILDLFVPLQGNSYLYYLPDTFWSQKCLLISEHSFKRNIGDDKNINGLAVLAMFLLQENQAIAKIGKSKDTATQELYIKCKNIFYFD